MAGSNRDEKGSFQTSISQDLIDEALKSVERHTHHPRVEDEGVPEGGSTLEVEMPEGGMTLDVDIPEGGFEFVNEVTGGSVPREFIKPTEQGIKEALERGIVAGYPMTGVRAILYDGSYHDVDSSEMAFKIAGSMAFQEGAKKAAPILMEPIMDVEVVTPEDYAGDVMGDLSRRRGKIQQMDERGGAKVIRAHVPLSEMFGYATTVRSMSQGRASYTMQFLAYEPAPKNVAEEVIAKSAGATQRI